MTEDLEERVMPPEPAEVARRSALRIPVMLAILTAEAFSALGVQMTFLALPWFVLTTTGSATQMGLVFAVELAPVALLGMLSGSLIQRLGVRRMMFVCDLARLPLIAAVPLLHTLDLLIFPLLLVIVFMVGALSAPYLSAQRLLIPLVFGDDEALTVQGNGLLDGVIRLATLVGPAAAGMLVGFIGAVNVLYVNAATYLISFLILYTWLPRRSSRVEVPEDQRGALAGARFVLRNPLLRRVSLAALLFGLFFPPLLATLPVLTERDFGGDPKIAGFLFAAWGAGAVIGTFGVLRYATRMTPMQMGALAGIGVALPLWLLLLPLTAWQFGLVLLVSGIFTPMLNAPVVTMIMLRSPEVVRPQVIAFVITANLLAGPIGYGLAGPLLDQVGITPVVLIVAMGVTLAGLLMLTLRRADAEPAPTPA